MKLFPYPMRPEPKNFVNRKPVGELLLRVAIEPERDVQDRHLTANGIEELLKRHAIRYVVAETGFWDDLPSMSVLTSLLNDKKRFAVVRWVGTRANYPNADRELVVYEHRGEVGETLPLGAKLVGNWYNT